MLEKICETSIDLFDDSNVLKVIQTIWHAYSIFSHTGMNENPDERSSGGELDSFKARKSYFKCYFDQLKGNKQTGNFFFVESFKSVDDYSAEKCCKSLVYSHQLLNHN